MSSNKQPDEREKDSLLVARPLIDLSLKFFVCRRLLLMLLSSFSGTQTVCGAEKQTGSGDIVTKQLELHNAPCMKIISEEEEGVLDARELQGL